WINPLLWKGYKKELDIGDLYSVPKVDKAEKLGNRSYRFWKTEIGKKHPSLTRAILRSFGLRFGLTGIYILFEACLCSKCECGLHIVQPLLIAKLIDYFTPGSDISFDTAVLIATGIVMCSVLYPVTHHPYFFGVCHVGMKIRIACCNLILRLSNAALNDTTAGHMVNLLSNDVSRFDQGIVLLHFLWVGPLQAGIATYILWVELGVACIIGIMILILLIPVQIFMGRLFWSYRIQTARFTDDRLRLTNEVVTGMRIIKFYGWEKPFAQFVETARKKESKVLIKTAMVRAMNMAIYAVSIKLILFLTFLIYLSMGNTLTAHTVFLTVALYYNVRIVMTLFFPFAASQGAEVLVSIKRIEAFLLLEETTKESEPLPAQENIGITLDAVTAFWEKDSEIPTLKHMTANIKKNHLFAIIGPVGSGKTSLLMAILQELPLTNGVLSLTGSLAYTSQQPWIYHATVRSNIIMGNAFIRKRYSEVIRACSLETDISLLPYGDQTLVGERGAVLSGGQKARVNLARALYVDADIYLLDDPFSAVDAEVGRHIYEKCICEYLQDKTRILVTHQLQFLQNADQVMVLKNGECVALGSYDELIAKGVDLERMTGEAPEKDEIKPAIAVLSDVSLQKRLGGDDVSFSLTKFIFESKHAAIQQIPEELRNKGSIKGNLYWQYIQAGGNTCLTLLLILFTLTAQVLYSGMEFWLAYWTNSVQEQAARRVALNGTIVDKKALFKDDNEERNLSIYAVLLVCLFVFSFVRCLLFYYLCVAASINLHKRTFNAVLRSPIAFFDANPVGRILNRFAKDIGVLDELLPLCLDDCIDISLKVVGIIVLVCITNYWLIFPTIILGIIFILLRRFYMKTSRALKRLDSITRSPVFSHLSSTLDGLTTVRAFHVEEKFQHEFNVHQDFNSSAWFLFLAAGRWLAIYLDCLCNYETINFVNIIESKEFLSADPLGGDVGLAITSSLGVSGMFQWGVRQSAEVESQMISVERLIEYTKLEPEAALESSANKKPPSDWPNRGEITFKHVSVQYNDNANPVLSDLSFLIKSGEKIGIVGRTGAGKSTLIATLFRLTEPIGAIEIDHINIQEIGLDDVRPKISIIPQDPILFQAARNLDCFFTHTDDELWGALADVKMKEFFKELPNGLDTEIQGGGHNLSVGQRQLLCLARAILRNNKILILDEATANVDHETDVLIQETIRTQFKTCTVLTVAHRLNTIIDSDRVMVLSEGKLMEFDSPYELLLNKTSYFSELVNATGKSNSNHLKIIAGKVYKAREKNDDHKMASLERVSLTTGEKQSTLILKCLTPRTFVPWKAVIIGISNMCTNKLTKRIQTRVAEWIYKIFKNIDDTKPLHSLYDILFHYLDTDYVSFYVVNILSNLTKKSDSPTHFTKLLHHYRTLCPDEVACVFRADYLILYIFQCDSPGSVQEKSSDVGLIAI
uniref:Uncharacterized protein n=1 Tax=Strigamia maritima TaxID=126957 RepID=T1IW00_STRMM